MDMCATYYTPVLFNDHFLGELGLAGAFSFFLHFIVVCLRTSDICADVMHLPHFHILSQLSLVIVYSYYEQKL